jgi:hypothetical protein
LVFTMNLERGFRRLLVVLSVAVLSLGIGLGVMLGSWPQFIGVAGFSVALLWLGFFAVRWISGGFASPPSKDDPTPSRRGSLENGELDPLLAIPTSGPMSPKRKRLWVFLGIVCALIVVVSPYFFVINVERVATEATEIGLSSLIAYGVAYLLTYLCRRKTWPSEDWGTRLLRLRHDAVFWSVFFITFMFLVGGANLARREWRVYSSAEGGFELLGPGTPTVNTTVLNAPSGPVEQHSISFDPAGALSFGVAYLDIHPSRLAEGVDAILSDAVGAMASGAEKTLLDDKEISLGGHPGREFGIRTQKGQTTRARVYVMRGRLYILVVNGAPGKDLSDEAPRFLNSFKLLSE